MLWLVSIVVLELSRMINVVVPVFPPGGSVAHSVWMSHLVIVHGTNCIFKVFLPSPGMNYGAAVYICTFEVCVSQAAQIFHSVVTIWDANLSGVLGISRGWDEGISGVVFLGGEVGVVGAVDARVGVLQVGAAPGAASARKVREDGTEHRFTEAVHPPRNHHLVLAQSFQPLIWNMEHKNKTLRCQIERLKLEKGFHANCLPPNNGFCLQCGCIFPAPHNHPLQSLTPPISLVTETVLTHKF